MVLNVGAAAVEASAGAEGAISASLTAATSAAAGAIVAVMPMGADLDSIEFAAALNAAGVAYIGVASEHIEDRTVFAGAQSAAAATYTVTDVVHNAALAL